MPLQQIGTSFNRYSEASQRNSRLASAGDVEAELKPPPLSPPKRSNSLNDPHQHLNGASQGHLDDDSHENNPYADRDGTDMALRKLGGVGGVQRSGSWGRDAILQKQRVPSNERKFEEEESPSWPSSDDPRIPSSQPLHPVSRSSTLSSSAAAFSLRSVSNRDSASSTSSGASSSQHGVSETYSTSSSKRSSRADDGSDAAPSTLMDTETNTVDAEVNTVDAESNTTDANFVRDADSQVGPTVQRIRSIGRGQNTRLPHQATSHDDEDSSDKTSLTGESAGEDTTLVAHRSPLQPASTYASTPPRSGESSRIASPSQLSARFSDRIETLSLSAAAQESQPLDTPEVLSRTQPRRHTGSFALRSFSALSSSGPLHGQFTGGGQGRAAARESSQAPDPYARLEAMETPRTKVVQIDTDDKRSSQFATLSQPVSPSCQANAFQANAGWHNESQEPTVSFDGLLGPSATTRDGTGSMQASLSPAPSSASSEMSHASRAPMNRSSTQLIGTNVLRTPTTEEWSRYLIKQGLDPASMATASVSSQKLGLRSRSSTSKSVQGWKRYSSEREAFSSPSQPDLIDADSVWQEGSILDHTYMTAGRERRRQPRISASALSMTSSLRGDDLDSVHEEGTDGHCDNEEDIGDEVLSDSDERDSTDSDIDERMRALHEAISRPPSRHGTPIQADAVQDKGLESIDLSRFAYNVHSSWPSRETAADMMGYPIPPLGEQRKIEDFCIMNDIGRGAYGLVKRARLKDVATGEPVGQAFCIKYIIKSRILADCWRRHKTLGPIPVEIHVLDQLRRIPYHMPSVPPAWSAERLFDLRSDEQKETEKNDHQVSVGHPALCTMLDFFEDHEFYYMVMPIFGHGQDLFDYVESQPEGLSTIQVRCILGQLADGLQFLHANNIVHRDVKDENVILDGKGHIQLIDFGSAAHINTKATGSAAKRLFDTFSGTLDYAAAEILRGEKYSGKEQDVWALGVVAYVLVCGDCPFWNGEEAMEGLLPHTRASTVLKERCEGFAFHKHAARDNAQIDVYPMDEVFIGRARPSTHQNSQNEADRRHRDWSGQTDGGGRLADAADLIRSCLDLDPSARPSMEQLCCHRFLYGSHGWSGPLGWQRVIPV